MKVVTLVTTLLDPKAYPAEALADLYRSRWQVETNFAHLKTTLQSVRERKARLIEEYREHVLGHFC